MTQSQQRILPFQQSSVALPLGINGAARHAKTGPLGPNNRQPLPELKLKSRRPAPGFRSGEGITTNIGNYGLIWSASTKSISGLYLYSTATGLGLSHTSGRTNGLPLRCLSE